MKLARTLPEAGAPGWRALLAAAGSPRLALWLIGALGLAIAAGYRELTDLNWAVAVPLALIAANIAAAIATQPAFRTQGALLVFHLALIAVAVLAALGRLTYLKGAVELSDGQPFDGALMQREAGPWHPDRLSRLRFTSLGFEIRYAPGLRREQTVNRIAYAPEGGLETVAEIGDATPLRLGGYRFYTSSNKGYAPELVWTSRGGAPQRGTLHMPSYPAEITHQKIEWKPPGAKRALHLRLDLDDNPIDLSAAWTMALPAVHAFEVREGDTIAVLRPGESRQFGEGTLLYAGLRRWMGYTVSYDWTLPWLFAAGAIGAAALAWHLVARFRARPWQAAEEPT